MDDGSLRIVQVPAPFRHLVSLVGRAFYGGPCPPPPRPEGEGGAVGRPASADGAGPASKRGGSDPPASASPPGKLSTARRVRREREREGERGVVHPQNPPHPSPSHPLISLSLSLSSPLCSSTRAAWASSSWTLSPAGSGCGRRTWPTPSASRPAWRGKPCGSWRGSAWSGGNTARRASGTARCPGRRGVPTARAGSGMEGKAARTVATHRPPPLRPPPPRLGRAPEGRRRAPPNRSSTRTPPWTTRACWTWCACGGPA